MIGPRGRDLIRSFESLRLEAYDDGGGVWTVGWGSTRGVTPGMVITRERAEQMFADDLAEAEASLDALVDVKLSQGQRDALASFVFNLGAANFGTSTLRMRVNAREWHEASREFARWDKQRIGGALRPVRGLLLRRHQEAALFCADPWPA
jgi:lysozyme